MYKQVLKTHKSDLRKKEKFVNDLHKNAKNSSNSVLNRRPHFIFSAENPHHNKKIKMSHEDIMEFLSDRGYKIEELQGKYKGGEERSILIHDVPKHAVRHLQKLAGNLGQDSSIYSDGYNHELHFHGGESSGRHMKGQGTANHKRPPEDNYSTMGDGTHFTHNFSDDLYTSDKSMIMQKPEKINKSESNGVYRPILSKNEGSKHPLAIHEPSTKLIHFSPKQGLEEINPEHHGVRGIGAEAKTAVPEHKMSFHYLEGVEPESIVTSGAKSKYISSLGDKKIYDIGTDPDGLWQQAKEIANKRSINPGIVQKDDYHKAIRNSGYHGIYNSSLNNTMSKVIGMFEPIKPDKEYPIHANDHKETSSKDHHANAFRMGEAKDFADKTGHHNHEFLHKLNQSLSKR